jgi:hypothetical protein
MPDQGALSAMFSAFQTAMRGRNPFFGDGARGAAPLVPTGTYTAAVTINGVTTRVPLRVERVSGGDGSGSAFGEP